MNHSGMDLDINLDLATSFVDNIIRKNLNSIKWSILMKSTTAKLSNSSFYRFWNALKAFEDNESFKKAHVLFLYALCKLYSWTWTLMCICSNFQGHLSRRRSDNSEVNVIFSNSEWDKMWTIIKDIIYYICIEYSK